jgi:hypothetical protein
MQTVNFDENRVAEIADVELEIANLKKSIETLGKRIMLDLYGVETRDLPPAKAK